MEMKCPNCDGMMHEEEGMMKCEGCGHTMPKTDMPAADAPADMM